MWKYRDPLGYSQFWAVRWFAGTFFLIQIVAAAIGAYTLAFGSARLGLWMGAALSMPLGFVLGLVAQYKMDRTKLSEYRSTVWITGLIVLFVFGFAVARATGRIHAG